MNEKGKRRWFRFSLRALWAAVTVVAVLLGSVGWRLARARHDQHVLAELRGVNVVSYDMSMSSPERLKTIWVMQHFYGVDGLEFAPLPHVSDDTLKQLNKLPRLEKLKIESDALTDDGLRHLVGINRLRVLGVSSPNITDDGLLILGDMKHLQVVAVAGSRVTAPGLEHLKQRLPNCQIKRFEMIDVIAD